MIKNIIFDFGDIFINLDKPATEIRLKSLGLEKISQRMLRFAQSYEMGLISTLEFIQFFKELYPSVRETEFTDAWNAILLDTPQYRLDFIKDLAEHDHYRLFLLSNTNDLHIQWVKNNWGIDRFEAFKNCFEGFYLSHEIGLRKPNFDVYEFVLRSNQLLPNETLFIDDTKLNTEAASKLGICTWNLVPGNEDVVQLINRVELKS